MSLRSVLVTTLLCAALPGCGGDARVELSAGDAINAVAREMGTTIEEYHQDVSQQDDAREHAIVAAFVTRVRGAQGDEAATSQHAAEFEEALRRIRADRETEWGRRQTAMDNVAVLREVSKGLQKLAIQSLSLQDEMRRYLESWIQMRQDRLQSKEKQPAPAAQNAG